MVVDHSNLTGRLGEKGIDYAHFLGLLGSGRQVNKAVMVGSHPYPRSSSARTWEEDARHSGWGTIAFHRYGGREQGVDEAIHAQISSIALDEGRRRLVLVTGDGNNNGGPPNTNFLDTIRKLLMKEVAVDLWSWRTACHHDYIRMADSGVHGFTLNYLDELGL